LQQLVTAGYVMVVDARGTVRCATGRHAGWVGRPAFAGAGLVRDAIVERRKATRGPFSDPVLGRRALFTSFPLPGGGELSLILGFDPQQTLVLPTRVAGMSTVLVDARTGEAIAQFPARPTSAGALVVANPLATAKEPGGAAVEATGADKVRRLYTAAEVSGTPYRVLMGLPTDVAFAPVRATLLRNGLVGGALVLVVAVLGFVLQRRVAQPALALRRAILELGRDPSAAPAPVRGPAEFASVARAFNETTVARRRSDGLTGALVQNATDLLLVIDPSGELTFVAPAAARMLGARVGDRPLTLARLIHPADRERLLRTTREWLASPVRELHVELRVRDVAGDVHHLDVHAQDLRDDEHIAGIVLAARDDTRRRHAEEILAFQATHDSLTGLPNRASLLERLEDCLGPKARQDVAVLFLDLDRFKLVNDSHGHAVGDEVLVALASRLERLVAPGDVLGRMGGDEFVLLARSAGTRTQALELAQRVRRELDEPVQAVGKELYLSGSVGITLAQPGASAAAVLREADTAMYRAKAAGRNCALLFDDEMRQQATLQLKTEVDLHHALQRQEMSLHFQPVVDLAGGAVVGVEALMRWQHPDRGMVSPAEFIPIAEESGLVVPLGRWALEEACRWAAAQPDPVRVSVNMSPRQLVEPDVVEQVLAVLADTGLPAHLLCLEITETALMHDAATSGRTLSALHDRGVQVSIDDFGTGWGSITYLQQFPVDEIKIDRSFVSRVAHDPPCAAIVAALIQMAHSMGLTVVAEGVETPGQAQFLLAQGCDRVQGYLFSKPLPAAEVVKVLGTTLPGTIPAPRQAAASPGAVLDVR
jgi:diguanylate cyclase (GGDEF)-like protein/PAS domain S-box-containing protein